MEYWDYIKYKLKSFGIYLGGCGLILAGLSTLTTLPWMVCLGILGAGLFLVLKGRYRKDKLYYDRENKGYRVFSYNGKYR